MWRKIMTDNVEVLITFDTTGSMSPCIGEVRRKVEESFAPLLKEIPNLRIGIIAHGDYCDEGRTYVTKHIDFTNNLFDLANFVRTTGTTGGGDAPECYEYVLHLAKSFTWSLNSKKIIVMIGDASPHDPSYPMNKLRLDWRKETADLRDMGVNIYSVQALRFGYRSNEDIFYSTIASMTNGFHLQLNQFNEIIELLTAVVYKQESQEALDAWEKRVSDSKRMSRSLDETFRTLSGRKESTRYAAASSMGLVPVSPGRFQILDVDHDIDIRGFVESNSIAFVIGRGFYQFTKTEEIQEKKEVVLRDKFTGDMFTGAEARNMIGVPLGTRDRLRPAHLEKFDIFVQSTSVNRKLKAGTKFLYEVDSTR
jgi:hypothetical protein